jgi:hypothetical protein
MATRKRTKRKRRNAHEYPENRTRFVSTMTPHSPSVLIQIQSRPLFLFCREEWPRKSSEGARTKTLFLRLLCFLAATLLLVLGRDWGRHRSLSHFGFHATWPKMATRNRTRRKRTDTLFAHLVLFCGYLSCLSLEEIGETPQLHGLDSTPIGRTMPQPKMSTRKRTRRKRRNAHEWR